ncbi:ion transporter [Synechococcus sp. CBW1108]|uniref:ion transporter n=1 Tax=Synechococcus sp. CBW1108 TaxID=1353147 RepID=UPI0018CF97F9|nr:ion transporter [Synechococcus sp. CBW1108]QPN69720.1 ion transporter [Synechococcus sp. CBW1108]
MAGSGLRQRVWELLDVSEDPQCGVADWDWVDVILLVLILLNVLAVILETVQSLQLRFGTAFWAFEVFSVGVFSVEYAARIWSCTADPRYRQPIIGRLRFVSSFGGVVDLLAILPFYVSLAVPSAALDLRILRALRLLRFARVLKLARYSDSIGRMKRVIGARRGDLGVALAAVGVVLILASSAIYYVEADTQPDIFTSIPAAMWWGISALTTVGYGDIAPVTPLGKFLGGIIQLLGIAIFALPAGIIAAGYEEESRRNAAGPGICKSCGRPLVTENTPEQCSDSF